VSEITDLIRAVPLFAALDDQEFAQLVQMVETIGSLEGTVLFNKGDPSDCFYVVALGRADIRLDDDTVVPLGTGEFFGEMGVLNSAPRNADAVAGEAARTRSSSRSPSRTSTACSPWTRTSPGRS
jgi:CRP-like cAMP-binding protein